MLYIYAVGTWPSAEVLRVAWLSALGVSAGLLSRWVLGNHTGTLRFFTALFGVIAGLWAAEWITNGYVGFEILYFDHPYPDYIGLIELGIPWLAAIFALRAWKKGGQVPVPAVKPVPAPAFTPEPIPASTKVKPIPVQEYSKNSLQNVFAAIAGRINRWYAGSLRWMREFENREITVTLSRRVASEPMIGTPPSFKQVGSNPYALTITSPLHRQEKSDRLEDEEKHRCPYCLDYVDVDDYRGVKVCPVCGAFHHADCWDVTGSCRAPHARK
jgi:hypothetical protein